MSYAIRNDGQGWRVVNGPDDVGPDETFSTEQPGPIVPSAAAIIEAKKEAVRQVREDILNRLAGITLAAGLTGDEATATAYVAVRQGLLDITKNWPDDPEQIDALVLSRYAALRDQCTPAMVGAFAQLDA